MVDRAALQDLMGRWWWNYDEGNFEEMGAMLSDDIHFTCRTDTGMAEWEEFARADLRGREQVMAWQIDHRSNSPYPLRHNGTNVHVVDATAGKARFSSYILVTQLLHGVPAPLSSGIVSGAVTDQDGSLQFSGLHIVLDTMESDVFSKVKS